MSNLFVRIDEEFRKQLEVSSTFLAVLSDIFNGAKINDFGKEFICDRITGAQRSRINRNIFWLLLSCNEDKKRIVLEIDTEKYSGKLLYKGSLFIDNERIKNKGTKFVLHLREAGEIVLDEV